MSKELKVKPSGKRVSYLESIRGLASLLVFITHTSVVFFPYLVFGSQAHPDFHIPQIQNNIFSWGDWIHESPLYIFFSGQFAVYIFFILSGYVLATPFLGENGKELKAKILSSLIKRPIRLLPLCYFSSLIIIILVFNNLTFLDEFNLTSGTSTPYVTRLQLWPWAESSISIRSFLSNFSSFNTVLWSIKVELYGSFILLANLLLFSHLKWRWAFFLITAYFSLLKNYDLFFLWRTNR